MFKKESTPTNTMSMLQILPGDVGRIINSFTCERHVDATEWQRCYRQKLLKTNKSDNSALLAQIRASVYLISSKHTLFKYSHVIRVPDYRRLLSLVRILDSKERTLMSLGGLPPSWYPVKYLRTSMRIFRNTPILSNSFVIDVPEPLPWEACCNCRCPRHRETKKRKRLDVFQF
jgi:hypothetical protein